MSTHTQHRLFAGFGGVALADILANGVSIIIMMIVITIMIKHEQEEKRLEQVEDVSVLLSRDLATSVVMNSLPTSPPARLHNYRTSPLDRNPTHTLMPIIELHTDYIRNYYTGEKISRDELLHNDNTFDRYIKTLNQNQLLRMRVDIYSIRLFYIVMSILKDYKKRPNHWHFIGYPEGGSNNTSGNRHFAKGGEKTFTDKDTQTDKPGEGKSEQGEPGEATKLESNANQGVPQSAELHSRPGGLENYPHDDLAFKSGGLQKQQAPEDLPGNISEPTSERARVSDEMFDTLAQMLAQSTGGKSKPQSRLSRFRSARAAGSENEGQQLPGSENETMKLENFRLLLPALFAFMQEIQTEADAGGATHLAEYNFRRDVLQLLTKVPPPGTYPAMDVLFDRLNVTLSATLEQTDAPLPVEQQQDEHLRTNALAVPINQRVQNAALLGNSMQEVREDLPGEVEATLHFGLYPAIFRGLRAPLKKDAVVLMPPDQKDPEEFRWRVVTMVNPEGDDFMTAFLYAALDDNRRLLIASEENALNISELRVTTIYPTLPFRNEQWLLLLYGIPALLIAFGVLRRTQKPA